MTKYLFLFFIASIAACSSDPDVLPEEEEDIIEIVYSEAEPCTSANDDCLQTITLTSEEGRKSNFNFYQNYPIMNDTAVWGKIKNAVIVLHGNNRNANNYFSFMTTALSQTNLLDSTLLIAPQFNSNTTAGPGELYWSNNWRIGDLSGNPSVKIGTFVILDSLLSRIADKEHFPFLEKVIITGHSSGATFTHTYALAKDVNGTWGFEVDYVVANSQYFYYPQDVRFNPSSGNFDQPADCPEFNEWPYGFESTVPYLEGFNRESLNEKFIKKRITYLLGTNDVVTSGSLNTASCAAVLLGEHRLNRGENMFSLMQTLYSNEHNHQKILINNVGHNGQAMYNSISYKALMLAIFTD